MLALKGRLAPRLAYQLTLFSQYSAVNFHPDVDGDLIFDGLASKVFRGSFANGSQADATWSVAGNQLGFGYYCNLENVEIDDHAMTFPGSAAGPTSDVPIAIVDDHNFVQALYGLYIQDHLQPTARLGITLGVRWDQDGWLPERSPGQPANRAYLSAGALADDGAQRRRQLLRAAAIGIRLGRRSGEIRVHHRRSDRAAKLSAQTDDRLLFRYRA